MDDINVWINNQRQLIISVFFLYPGIYKLTQQVTYIENGQVDGEGATLVNRLWPLVQRGNAGQASVLQVASAVVFAVYQTTQVAIEFPEAVQPTCRKRGEY